MTKSQIQYILALDEFRNFGAAANACFISQSTLSAMVAKFEAQAGIEIFNRKTRPITVTIHGQQLIKSLRSIYREYQLLDETINDVKGIEIGDLSMACIPTVAPYLYPVILNRISEKFPKVNFNIYELTTENILDEISNGKLDIGIASIPLENDQLIEYPLYEEAFFIYDCGKKAKSKKYSVSDIDLDRLWLLEEGHCLRNQVSTICELRQQKQINNNLTYNCGSIYTLIEMVKRNNGVTLLPHLALINNAQIENKNVFKISQQSPSRKIGIITHKNFVKKRSLKAITNLINEAMERFLPMKDMPLHHINPF